MTPYALRKIAVEAAHRAKADKWNNYVRNDPVPTLLDMVVEERAELIARTDENIEITLRQAKKKARISLGLDGVWPLDSLTSVGKRLGPHGSST